MEPADFEELLAQARQVGQVLKTVFREIADEELDLESGIRHYPLVALSLAAGAGVVAGWWLHQRRHPQLPPPPPPKPSPTRAYLERVFPGSSDQVRKVVPDSMADDAAKLAKNWVDTVLTPKLKQSIDSTAANAGESKLGTFLRQTLKRMDTQDDVHLDDPGGV